MVSQVWPWWPSRLWSVKRARTTHTRRGSKRIKKCARPPVNCRRARPVFTCPSSAVRAVVAPTAETGAWRCFPPSRAPELRRPRGGPSGPIRTPPPHDGVAHSGFIPASLMIGLHISVSAASRAASSFGVEVVTGAPMASYLCNTDRFSSAATASE